MVTSHDGRSKGFAYVQFETPEGVRQAMKLNGQELEGRPVRLDQSGTEKSSRGGRGGRGGFRGGFR